MVREVGLEPTRHCCRQDLNLVRLPISPLTRVFAANPSAASLRRVFSKGREKSRIHCLRFLTASAILPSKTSESRLRKPTFPATPCCLRCAKPGILTESMANVCRGDPRAIGPELGVICSLIQRERMGRDAARKPPNEAATKPPNQTPDIARCRSPEEPEPRSTNLDSRIRESQRLRKLETALHRGNDVPTIATHSRLIDFRRRSH
jgi:hypothetical protein